MRDTDNDWAKMSQSEPYFAVLTSPIYLKDNITTELREDFFRSGRTDIAQIVEMIRAHVKQNFAPRTALDFGCGVGRLSLAMSDYASSVVGIDISPAMLKEADINKHLRYPDRDIRFTDKAPETEVDWISSVLVLQHIPPARGIKIVEDLLSKLSPGGVVSLQFTAYREMTHMDGAFDEAQYVRFDGLKLDVIKEKAGPEVRMSMFDYDMTSVLAAYVNSRVHSMWVEHVNHGGHHAFWVIGEKAI